MWAWFALGVAAALPLDSLDWVVVNDTVMGGVSSSQVAVDDTLVFSGELSLEQNGGFASIRARVDEGAFAGVSAIRLEVDGDGRTYDLTLRRRDVPLRAGSYGVQVPTEVGRSEVVVPIHAFRPTSFGRPVNGAPALDAGLAAVDTVGLMLADKRSGPFSIELLSLSLVRAEATVGDRPPVLAVLEAAIAVGVPAFNRGDAAGCRDAYASALRAALALDGLTPGERSLADDALGAAAEQAPAAAAWTLRHAMDSVLVSGPGPR